MNENPYELLYLIRMGNEKAMQILLESYRNTIEIIAKKCIRFYEPYRIYYDELIEEGILALQTAVWTYREDRETAFHTYVLLLIRRRMWRLLKSRGGSCGADGISYDSDDIEGGLIDHLLVCRDSEADPAYQVRYHEAGERVSRIRKELTEKEKRIFDSLLRGESRRDFIEGQGCTERAYDGTMRRIKKKVRDAVYCGS